MELRSIKEILDIYCQGTGMVVNMVKSSILFNELEDEMKTQIKDLFRMNYSDLDQGIKYLGFKLEPNDSSMLIGSGYIKKLKKDLSMVLHVASMEW